MSLDRITKNNFLSKGPFMKVTAGWFNYLIDWVNSSYKKTIEELITKTWTASDSGKVFYVDSSTAAATIILPTPVAGLHFKVVWVANNNNAMIIKTADTADTSGDMLRGGLLVAAAAAVNTFIEATSDINTLTVDDNLANAAGGVGSWIEIVCIKDAIWNITGVLNSTTDADGVGSANFSDTD